MMLTPANRVGGESAPRFDQFVIREGAWQEGVPRLRVAGEGAAGVLAALLESADERELAPEVCRAVLDTLAETFVRTPGPAMRALREAVLSANTRLFQANVHADAAHRALAGLVCAAWRGGELAIGQTGPALGVWVRQGEARCFPPTDAAAQAAWQRADLPSWLEMQRDPPLGLRKELEPALWRAEWQGGDVLLLASASLGRMGSVEELIEAVTFTASATARHNLEALADGRDVSVLIAQAPGGPGSAELRPATRREDVRVGDARPTETEGPLEGAELRSPTRREDARAGDAHPAEAEGSLGSVELRSTTRREDTRVGDARPIEPEDVRPAECEGVGPPQVLTKRAALGQAAGMRVYLPPPMLAAEELPSPEMDAEADEERVVAARPTSLRSAGGNFDWASFGAALVERAGRIRRGTEDMLLQVLPSELPERPPERAPETRLSFSGKALVGVALIVPLMVLFIVVMTRIQYERVNRAQLSAVQEKATGRCDAAAKLDDVNLQRQGLYDCLAAIEEGLAVIPGDPTLIDLRNRTLFRLDGVDKVERLYYFSRLAVLEDPPAGINDSARLVRMGKELLMLSRGNDRVYRFTLNDVGDAFQSLEANPVIMRRGDAFANTPVGDLVDLAWLGEEMNWTVGAFAALDRTGTLFTYDPQRGVRVQPVADSDQWLKPAALGTFSGNLYVLDPLLGRVLKYVPVNGTFTRPPTDYISSNQYVDLTGAVDMAIDGNLYVLYADGRVIKYFNGEPKPFTMQGLPTSMRAPTSIVVSGVPQPDAQGYVFVLDAGNERILQFDKEGTYLRQFRAKADDPYFTDLRGLYVDEAEARLIVYSGNTLWITSLPKLQGQ